MQLGRGSAVRKQWLAAAAAAAIALAGASAGAQETGTVQGTVTLVGDIGPVHGALVLVVGTGATTLTEEDGTYVLENVPAGAYEVLAQREHLTAERQMITVVAGEAATADFVLAPSPVHEQVTVTAAAGGTATTFEAFNAVTTLDSFDLIQTGQNSLGDALQHEPGIAVRSFGPGSSRPIIRGFDGDRVLILDDGIRTGDLSSQSGDHGVTLDPNSAERIEIVRGPATLLYGSNAVGGLVNIISPQEAMHESMFEGTRAQISTDVGSANGQAGVNVNLQHAQGGLRLWAGGSTRRTGDYDTPEGTIANSATELSNARAGAGYDNGTFFASGGFTFEQGRYGVPFAEEFHGAHDVHDAHDAHGDEDDLHEGEEEGLEIDLASRRQVGRFDLGVRNLSNRLIEGLRVTMNVIDWGHDELEVEDGFENVGTSFDNRTYIVRAEFEQQQTERLSGRFGAWTQVRDFQATGFEALAPRTDLTSMAAFAYEEVDFGPVRLQFGGRIERNSYRAGDRMIGFDSEDRDDHDDHDHEDDEDDHDDHDHEDGEDDHDDDHADDDDHGEDDHDDDHADDDDHDHGEDDHDDDHADDDDHGEDDHDDDHADDDDHDHGEDDHDDDHADDDDHDHGEDDHDDDHADDDDHDHGEDDHDDDHADDDDHGEDDHDDDHADDDDHDHGEDDHDDDHADDDDHEGEDDHDHEGEDDDHEDEVLIPVPDPRDRAFLGASGSIGVHVDIGERSAFVANFTSTHRAPALEELYNYGPHVGNLAFEVGNPNLRAEETLGLDVSLRTRGNRVRGELNAYVYAIDGFIFGDRTDRTRDGLPVFNFVQGDSRFRGMDARGSVRLGGRAWATLGIGYVDARLTATNEPLPRIPPLRGTLQLDIPYGDFTVSPQLMYAARQDAIFRGETETDGYSVLNVLASYTWSRRHVAHVLTFTGYNLTNTLYRNHTSFIKDLAPEMGRGIRVGYSLRFF